MAVHQITNANAMRNAIMNAFNKENQRFTKVKMCASLVQAKD